MRAHTHTHTQTLGRSNHHILTIRHPVMKAYESYRAAAKGGDEVVVEIIMVVFIDWMEIRDCFMNGKLLHVG